VTSELGQRRSRPAIRGGTALKDLLNLLKNQGGSEAEPDIEDGALKIHRFFDELIIVVGG